MKTKKYVLLGQGLVRFDQPNPTKNDVFRYIVYLLIRRTDVVLLDHIHAGANATYRRKTVAVVATGVFVSLRVLVLLC